LNKKVNEMPNLCYNGSNFGADNDRMAGAGESYSKEEKVQ